MRVPALARAYAFPYDVRAIGPDTYYGIYFFASVASCKHTCAFRRREHGPTKGTDG